MLKLVRRLLHKDQTSNEEKIISALLFLAYVVFMGAISPEPGLFYKSLAKPAITPPSYVFGIVWPLLFLCLATSAYYVWNHYETKVKRRFFIWLYLLNGAFIYLWSLAFFGYQNLGNALYVAIALIITAELMIITAFKINQKASYYLLPYLLWLLFALYLNVNFIILN